MPAPRALLAAVATLAVLAPPAAADEPVSTIGRTVPLAGYGGWTAWSRPDGTRYRLVLRAPDGAVRDAPVAPERSPFDVQLGPDAKGRVVAVYSRCAKGDCDVHLLSAQTGKERVVRGAATARYDEQNPAIWKSTLAFTVHVRGCDIPLVLTLGSKRDPRQLLRTCVTIENGHLAIRGDAIVTSATYSDEEDNTFTDEIRLYSAKRRGSRVLYLTSYSQELNLLGQVAIGATSVTTVRHGNARHGFVRIPLAGGKPTELRANLDLTGSLAQPRPGVFAYVQSQGSDSVVDDEELTGSPYRVILGSRNPFGAAERRLPPELTIAIALPPGRKDPQRGKPLTLRGKLTRKVMAHGKVVRTVPVAGVPVELRHVLLGSPNTFEPTPYRGTTGPDGSYELVVPSPKDALYTAVAATPGAETWAGPGTDASLEP